MSKGFKIKRKSAVISLALGLLLGGGGFAFAYFTAQGAGNGSATVGSASPVNITQIGAAYDSLNANMVYHQDQCFTCASVSAFGNQVHLATTGRLSDVVVAMRNWSDAITNGGLTFTVYNVGAGNSVGSVIASDHQLFNFPAWNSITQRPSVSNITFDFSSQNVTLPSNVIYGITYDDPTGSPPGDPAGEASLNVGLSNAASELSVGSDPIAGYVYVNTSNLSGWESDSGTCGGNNPTLNTFVPTYIYCGNTPPANVGAYGDSTGYDIPSVEFNVVGGVVPPLYPGDNPQNIEYAIANPGLGSSRVSNVTVAVAYDSANGFVQSDPGHAGSDVANCYASWYQVTNSPQAVNTDVAGHSTTMFNAPKQIVAAGNVVTLQMLNPNQSQDACQGAQLALVFTSN